MLGHPHSLSHSRPAMSARYSDTSYPSPGEVSPLAVPTPAPHEVHRLPTPNTEFPEHSRLESFFGIVLNVHDAMLIIEGARSRLTTCFEYQISMDWVRSGSVFVERYSRRNDNPFPVYKLEQSDFMLSIKGRPIFEKRVTVTTSDNEEYVLRSFYCKEDVSSLHQPIAWARKAGIRIKAESYPMYSEFVVSELRREESTRQSQSQRQLPRSQSHDVNCRQNTTGEVLPPPSHAPAPVPNRLPEIPHVSRTEPSSFSSSQPQEPLRLPPLSFRRQTTNNLARLKSLPYPSTRPSQDHNPLRKLDPFF